MPFKSWSNRNEKMGSLHIWDTAPVRETSLYSLYILIVSVLERYLSKMPKFFIELVFLSKTYTSNDCTLYLLNTHDFSLTFSHFVLSFHEVPELRFSEDRVLGKHSDSVEGGIRFLF